MIDKSSVDIAVIRALLPTAQSLKKDNHMSAYKVIYEGAPVFVKHFHPRKKTNRLKSLLGLHRSKQNHQMSIMLREAGFLTPESFGYAINNEAPAKLESWFYSEYLSTMQDLRSVYHSGSEVLPHVLAFSKVLAEFHTAGFYHGDMKWANIFVAPNSLECAFIDLDGCQRTSNKAKFSRDFKRFMKNVYQSTLTDTEAAMVVAEYCRASAMDTNNYQRQIALTAEQECWRDMTKDQDPL